VSAPHCFFSNVSFRHSFWLLGNDIVYDTIHVAIRNRNYSNIVRNVKDVRYRGFVGMMTDHGYALENKRGSARAFVFDPSKLGKTEADFPLLGTGKTFTMHEPHPSGRRVDPAAVKGALRYVEYIRSVMGGGETSE